MRNYQKLLDSTIEKITAEKRLPSLLLHSCCAPCSSYVLEYLSRYFKITLFYFNPNITSKEEYDKRIAEQKRLISLLPAENPIDFIEGEYRPEDFFEIAKGLEATPEGGERCFKCYRLRIAKAAELAKEKGLDYFTTTLSVSPHKNAEKLNEIGGEESERTGVPYLFSDFKKREGYKRSIALSTRYGLYRQSYCGCIYSRKQAEKEGRI